MKKLVIAAILLAGFTATAGTSVFTNTHIAVFQEKQYKKIEVSQVSKEAMNNINKNYGAYTVKEAYRADDGEYKLVLTKDGVDLTATFTKEGNLIKIY